MKNARIATKFLTIAGRFGAAPGAPEQIGRAAIYFPFVGFAIGLGLIVLNRLLGRALESEIEAAVLVFALIIVTAAIHLEGLQKTTDLLVARRHKIDHLSAGTVYGMIAVVLVIIFKIRAIEVMGETRSIHLLLAPALARWALVVFLYGPNLESEDLAWRVAKQVTAWHLFVATAVTLAITIYLTGRAGLWVGLTISIVALLFRAYCQRQVSEISHHRFGALIEVSETLSLVLFASL